MPVGDPPFFFDGLDVLAERRMPTRRELDAVAPSHPVYIPGLFGSWGVPPGYSALNTMALQRNGITAATRQRCEGVTILKDEVGEPTGVIVETNPRPTIEFDILPAVLRVGFADRVEGLRRSMRLYNRKGTTSIYEGHGSAPETIAVYRHLWELWEPFASAWWLAPAGQTSPRRGLPCATGLHTRAGPGSAIRGFEFPGFMLPTRETKRFRPALVLICQTPDGLDLSNKLTRPPSFTHSVRHRAIAASSI
jgi:hypothetical protein